MHKTFAIVVFSVTGLVAANLMLVNLVLAQNISELCNGVKQDMATVNTKLTSNTALDQIKSDVGAILETWRVKYEDLSKQCTSVQCLQDSELWNKAETARQMKFYISSVDELVSSGLSKDEIVQKVDKFSKETVTGLNKICVGG